MMLFIVKWKDYNMPHRFVRPISDNCHQHIEWSTEQLWIHNRRKKIIQIIQDRNIYAHTHNFTEKNNTSKENKTKKKYKKNQMK